MTQRGMPDPHANTLPAAGGTIPERDAFAAAVASDRAYFECGAVREALPGATLAWLPGLAACPAAVVVHRIDPGIVASMGAAWPSAAEARLRELGATTARLYLDQPGTPADAVLRAAGLVSRPEIAFAGMIAPEGAPDCVLVPVHSEENWARKLVFHQLASERPDGHGTSAEAWVASERARCVAGGMEAFLIERGGQAVGAFGTIQAGPLLRVKNLVVHPRLRRQKVGFAMLVQAARRAREGGLAGICAFALQGGIGERLYRWAGLRAVGVQVEWSKPLT